ncbi:hypothetical protein CEXT_303921 [Caerostris extrusa]|uniref:Uncharacterized protein n=1 Tax=Caerostris extrusa TaxID=172846 RepID=A0AAV4PI95_CAEEX|nr:hypothetical protein CEXT_303921 [Caerostris extrusa]
MTILDCYCTERVLSQRISQEGNLDQQHLQCPSTFGLTPYLELKSVTLCMVDNALISYVTLESVRKFQALQISSALCQMIYKTESFFTE